MVFIFLLWSQFLKYKSEINIGNSLIINAEIHNFIFKNDD
jgi:hypothetical protein